MTDLIPVLVLHCFGEKQYQPGSLYEPGFELVLRRWRRKGFDTKHFYIPPSVDLSTTQRSLMEMYLNAIRARSFEQIWFTGPHVPSNGFVGEVVEAGLYAGMTRRQFVCQDIEKIRPLHMELLMQLDRSRRGQYSLVYVQQQPFPLHGNREMFYD